MHIKHKDKIGVRLEHARAKRNHTRDSLAAAARLPPSLVGDFESRMREPSAEILDRLAKALNVSIDSLANSNYQVGELDQIDDLVRRVLLLKPETRQDVYDRMNSLIDIM